MQASIHTFAEDGSGSALLDDGRVVSWEGEVFAGSALLTDLARPIYDRQIGGLGGTEHLRLTPGESAQL